MQETIKAPEGYKYVVVDETTVRLEKVKPLSILDEIKLHPQRWLTLSGDAWVEWGTWYDSSTEIEVVCRDMWNKHLNDNKYILVKVDDSYFEVLKRK